MSSKILGKKIKQARTDAGFTQAQLADLIRGLSASDISRAERGEKELERDQLIAIAKATGVTQKSLLEAAGTKKSSTSTSKKTGTTAKKTGTTAKKTGTTAKKTGSTASSGSSMKVTAAERKLVERYREADAKTKKVVNEILKGGKSAEALLSGLVGEAVDALFKG